MRILIASLVFNLLSAAYASADTALVCKKSNEATAQGYEAKINGPKAELFYKGKKVADLNRAGMVPSRGGDEKTVTYYRQNVVNGYAVNVESGGFVPTTSAIVLRGGVAGFTQQAQLTDCD